MPLPPALAAKLAKRGIINAPKDQEPESAAGTEEEIIAEDYDDTPQQTLPHAGYPPPAEPQTTDPFQGYPGCPNKWNVFHECTAACRDQWKERNYVDPEYDHRRLRMLAKYPLPTHWQEILDPGIGRYYYWNTETDLVSWLPPGHPKCQVSRSAGTLRKEMSLEVSRNKHSTTSSSSSSSSAAAATALQETADVEMTRVENEEDGDDGSDKSEGSGDEGSQRDKREERWERSGSSRDRDKGKDRSRGRDRDRRGRRQPASDELDPMDPASYGDCGRGTWSSGLPQRNEARTGADVTASGPLFQMRPYPSPGAVLKANAAATSIGPKKT